MIALFPLDYVLLPGLPLPLHVFEPRYRRLVTDVAAAAGDRGHGSFGVVLGQLPVPARVEPAVGSPAAAAFAAIRSDPGPRGMADIGTMAEIIENEPYADGRSDLLTVGSRRFHIEHLDAVSKPYLQAHVEFLDETDGPVDRVDFARARALSYRYRWLLSALTGTPGGEDLPEDPLRASYEIASRLQLTTGDRQTLLASTDAAQRLRAEVVMLRRELTLLNSIRAVPVPAHLLHVQPSLN